MSPSGRCQTLDAAADGYVRGEAAGVLLLSARERPVGDPLAALLATCVNQDGRSSTLTAPHGPSQTLLLQSALEQAGTSKVGDACHYFERGAVFAPRKILWRTRIRHLS